MSYPMQGKVRQQIHIPECLAEVRWTFPRSAANTLSPSENAKCTRSEVPSFEKDSCFCIGQGSVLINADNENIALSNCLYTTTTAVFY